MSNNPPPEPTPRAETGNPTTVTNISGGVNLDVQHDVTIGGDVVGRDKITSSIDTGGGTYVAGNLNVASGGEFVGRDKNVYTVVPRDKNLRILMEKVRIFWVEGVLENSVHHAALIELGKQIHADAVEVDHPWEAVVRTADQPDHTLPPQAKIIDVFDEMQGALLILGEPGSGKTTTLLELARDLIARAAKDSTLPVPVVFNLSSWAEKPQRRAKRQQPQAEKPQAISEWLVDELKAKYGVPGKMGSQWIENNDLILLLDGLDEVKSEHRRVCADAINTFRLEHGLTGTVVCSRTKEYEKLARRLKLSGAVLVRPLTREQVEQYIAAGGSRLTGLESALRTDVGLRELAEVPLTLSIMSLAYSGQSIDSLTAAPDDPTQRRNHLFSAYVDKMFARTARSEYKPYSEGDTIRWLTWLAARMAEHGQTVFLLEEMQTSWLLSSAQRRLFFTGYELLVMLLGLLVVLPWQSLAHILTFMPAWGFALWGFYGKGKIKPAELFKMSWPKLNRWLSGLMIGGLLGLMVGGLLGSSGLWLDALTGGLAGLMIGVLMGGLFFTLLTGLRVELNETKTKPNQGIWLSIRNAFFVALFIGAAGGMVMTLFMVTIQDRLGMSMSIGEAAGKTFTVMLPLTTVAWLFFGGSAFIQHFILRFILWRKGYTPHNYVRFLDYTADRILLRKVGGGYIFIHRMLMEYFAELEKQPDAQSNE